MEKAAVLEVAEKAGFTWLTTKDLGDELVRFAELVAAAEREACALVCDSLDDGRKANLATRCAEAIRERSNSN